MMKMNERTDQFFNPFDKGPVYKGSNGVIKDLSDIVVCNIAVDTVRQLYSGVVDHQVFNILKNFTASDSPVLSSEVLKNSSSVMFNRLKLPCDHMKLSRMGKGSGFRYKLQNNEVGIVILVGSYFSPLENNFSHLKIELSPTFIARRTVKEVQEYMDSVASSFLDDAKPSGVAPHLCVDLQGFTAPLDMEQHLVTKSRSMRSFVGIGSLKFHGLDTLAMKYGIAETITVGKPTAVQLTVYRKDLEIVKRDNVDYYHDLWGRFSMGAFLPEEPVTRVEVRFHHTVIKQFAKGINQDINSYEEVSNFLDNLWEYGLLSHCYEWDDSLVHPLWQMLMQDVSFNDDSDIRQDDFKRSFKTPVKNDTDAIKRNISMLVGNLCSIHARSTRKIKDIQRDIQNSPSIMVPLRLYFSQNGIDESIYFQHLGQKILERRVASKWGMAA